MYWALIKEGKVENVIVADDDYAQAGVNRELFDAVVQITELDPRPQVGWLYDGSNFTDPNPPSQEEAPPPPEVLAAWEAEGKNG